MFCTGFLSRAVLCAALAAVSFPANAGPDGSFPGSEVWDKAMQDPRIAENRAKLDDAIRSAFAAVPELQKAIEIELAGISAIKDSAEREKAIAAFQERFGGDYAKILGGAGINLQDYGDFEVLLLEEYGINAIASIINNVIWITAEPPPEPAPPPPPVPATRVLGEDDYAQRDGQVCFSGVWGRDSTPDGMHVAATVAGTGVCDSYLNRTYDAAVVVPGGGTLVVTGRMDVDGTVGGLLHSSCWASVVSMATGATAGPEAFMEVSLFAPLFWAASGRDSRRLMQTFTYSGPEPGSLVIEVKARAYINGVGGADCHARISELVVTATPD